MSTCLRTATESSHASSLPLMTSTLMPVAASTRSRNTSLLLGLARGRGRDRADVADLQVVAEALEALHRLDRRRDRALRDRAGRNTSWPRRTATRSLWSCLGSASACSISTISVRMALEPMSTTP
jgi:hypothetical protein